ncbi:DUF1772 domain-containing protein [Micromonospora marina]|uniref:DUF1772 domain-containing protein n=1 Tax=Micromonospora marina TaxID=307120 RepID=UPI003455C2A7
MIVESVRTAATALLGLYAGGVFFTVITPSVGRMPPSAYVPYWQALNTDHGRAMPPFLLACLVLLIATAVLSYGRGRPVFILSVIAALLVIATIVLTVSQLEPLNRVADTWSADRPPANWAAERDRWITLHTVRTVAAVLAFASLLIAKAVDRPSVPSAQAAASASRTQAGQEVA